MACRSFSLSSITFTNANLVVGDVPHCEIHLSALLGRVLPMLANISQKYGILATDGSILATDVVDLSALLGLLGLFHLFF
jgi:hypothetical protein